MADWTRTEVNLIIADYFSMLNDEIAGKKYNKKQHREALIGLLHNRSTGAVEFKHQNISAALIELGYPYINGYKPLFNFQRAMLFEAIHDYLKPQKDFFEKRFEAFSDNDIIIPVPRNFDDIVVAVPEKQQISEPVVPYERRPIKINFIEREQKNIALGTQGEEFVVAYEKWLLEKAGKSHLADQIEWIAKTDDGAGFDILSRNLNGTDKYVEVKTTKLGIDAPFYFSKTEFEFSRRKAANYHLYRLFQFAKSPKMFQARGCFDDFCFKEAISYKGSFS